MHFVMLCRDLRLVPAPHKRYPSPSPPFHHQHLNTVPLAIFHDDNINYLAAKWNSGVCPHSLGYHFASIKSFLAEGGQFPKNYRLADASPAESGLDDRG